MNQIFFKSSSKDMFIDLRDENINHCLPYASQPGTDPATKACALTGAQTHTTFQCTGWRFDQLSHPAKAVVQILYSKIITMFLSGENWANKLNFQ